MAASVKSSTWSKYEKSYARYQRWASDQGLDHKRVSTLEGYVAKRGLDDGVLASLASEVSAIGFFWRLAGGKSPGELPRIAMATKGATKLHQASGTLRPLRDAFPVAAIGEWVRRGPRGGLSDEEWLRTAAILALGTRLMLRCDNIAKLRRKDVRRLPDGSLEVTLRETKTTGQIKLPVDAGNTEACPVALLLRYLEERPGRSGHLFKAIDSPKGLSSSAVGALVKRAAQDMRLPGVLSGHSLRIGGASAAVDAGIPELSVRSVGQWRSNAIFDYIRALDASKKRMSTRMGF